ncbi:MAG: hypothetical protein DMD79_27160 [Candidatus Rokuibacteriota bacterium]|nr:MAG: hypothetical protein DMD79_27160 [Candidatus Rokubacteria bacterium]
MADPQTLIREAQEKAERLCRLAVAQTPADYQSFITLIEQRKKVGGPRSVPIWATVRQPYLSADGRIKMARDQHREAGKRFDIQSEFLVEPTSGQLLARATLTSEIYGMAVAHARVFLGGEGVNESNPIENGETSAVARALGMWGFGCFGTGIASADEVLRVVERRDSRGNGGAAPGSANGGPASTATAPVAQDHDVPNDATETELARLGQALGLRPGEVALRRAQAPSDADAVTTLRGEVTARVLSDEMPREALPSLATGLGVEAGAYRRYLVARYQVADGEAPESALSEAQFREERERFVRRYHDAGTSLGFRDQCARLAGASAA